MFKKIISNGVIVFKLNKLRANCGATHIIKATFSNISSNYLNPPENSIHAPINDQLVDEIFKFKDTNISNWIIEVIYNYFFTSYQLVKFLKIYLSTEQS